MILVFAQRISINVHLPFKLLTLQLKTTMTISKVIKNLSCSFCISHESMNLVVKSILNWLLSFYWFDNKSINVVINTYSFSMFTSVWQVYIYIYIKIYKPNFYNQQGWLMCLYCLRNHLFLDMKILVLLPYYVIKLQVIVII